MCAWCGKDIDTNEKSRVQDVSITHGICESCRIESIIEMGMNTRDYLDTLDKPVLLLDSNLQVISGNKKAEEITGKQLKDILAFLPGQIFDCINIKEGEECGTNEACNSCSLRNSLEITLETGNCVNEENASLVIREQDMEKEFKFKHTTEVIGKNLLIRFDESNINLN